MTGLDKRTIISSKRARNKRKKAQRSTAKALVQLEAEHSGELTPTDGSSGDEAARRATRASAIAQALSAATNDAEEEDGDCEDEEDDDEMVFVCRPTMQDFCVQYVAAAQALPNAKVSNNAWADLRQFTVRIPAFRETRDGYTTYTITVTTAADWRKQFQLERRYSEFVAFAAALDDYLKSPHYKELREKLLGEENNKGEADESVESSDLQVQSFRWELPPKTWFRMTQATALEDRRSKLEASLQSLLAHEPHVICHIPVVRDFLMLDIFGAQVVEEKLQRV